MQRYDMLRRLANKRTIYVETKRAKTKQMNTEEINSELGNPFKNTNRAERENAKMGRQIYWRAVFPLWG